MSTNSPTKMKISNTAKNETNQATKPSLVQFSSSGARHFRVQPNQHFTTQLYSFQTETTTSSTPDGPPTLQPPSDMPPESSSAINNSATGAPPSTAQGTRSTTTSPIISQRGVFVFSACAHWQTRVFASAAPCRHDIIKTIDSRRYRRDDIVEHPQPSPATRTRQKHRGSSVALHLRPSDQHLEASRCSGISRCFRVNAWFVLFCPPMFDVDC